MLTFEALSIHFQINPLLSNNSRMNPVVKKSFDFHQVQDDLIGWVLNWPDSGM